MNKKSAVQEKRTQRSSCPVANTLETIGDRWTLLIVRDILKGKKRYNELLDSQERIPTNILANRLKSMLDSGLIEKKPYSRRPPRFEYELTSAGIKLGEIVKFLKKWGEEICERER